MFTKHSCKSGNILSPSYALCHLILKLYEVLLGLFLFLYIHRKRLPRWHLGKEPACQYRRCNRQGFDPWVGKIPWRRAWQPTPIFLLENLMDRGAWWAIIHRVAKGRTWLKQLSTHIHIHVKGNNSSELISIFNQYMEHSLVAATCLTGLLKH